MPRTVLFCKFMKIKLVKWKLKEQAALIRLCNEVDRRWLRNTIPYPYTPENAAWYIAQANEREGKDALFRAVVVDGEIVGNVTVEQKGDIFTTDAELGYLLLSEYTGRGIATEAVRQICQAAFEKMPILRLTAQVCAPNAASCRVLEKNGFLLEGRLKNAVAKNGQICDLLIYGKVKET